MKKRQMVFLIFGDKIKETLKNIKKDSYVSFKKGKDISELSIESNNDMKFLGFSNENGFPLFKFIPNFRNIHDPIITIVKNGFEFISNDKVIHTGFIKNCKIEIDSLYEEKLDIYTKWHPIIDALEVTDKKKRKIMAEYAEFHQQYQNENLIVSENEDIAQNLLPVSLKILSQLNLTEKNVILKQGLPTLSFDIDINMKQVSDMKDGGIDGTQIVIQLEGILTKKLVEYINKELETKDNLYLTTVAQSISLISEENFTPKMYLTSRIHID